MDKTNSYRVVGSGAVAGEQVHTSEEEARRQLRRAAHQGAQSGRPFGVELHGPDGELCRTSGNEGAPERLRKA